MSNDSIKRKFRYQASTSTQKCHPDKNNNAGQVVKVRSLVISAVSASLYTTIRAQPDALNTRVLAIHSYRLYIRS